MDNDVLTRDSDMNLAVRTVSSSGDSYVNPDDVYTRDSDGKLAVRVVGSGGGSVDESRIIVKSDTMPTAGSDYLGKFYCYSGATNATYTHGYIYECVAGSVSYEANFTYEKSTFASEDFYKAGQLLVDAGVQDPTLVTAGTMTYALDGNLWSIVFTDADGNALNEAYNIYTDDLEQDYDITPVVDPSEFTDGQVVHIAINNVIEHFGDFSWQRIDVQPNFQYATMPSATIGNAGKIVQYVGTTDANYTNGYFYKCDVVQTPEDFTPTVVSCSASIDLDILKESFGSASNWTHVFAYDSDSQNWYLDSGDTPVQLSDYGIEVQSLSAGATITCDYVAATITSKWETINVQPDLTAIEDYDPSANQVLENVYGTLKWIYK